MSLMRLYDEGLIAIMEQMARAIDMATAAYYAQDENNFEIALGRMMMLQAKNQARMIEKGALNL